MTFDLDAAKRRYTETVTVEDVFGRAIKIGRLRPSQQVKAAEMGQNESAANSIRLVCMVRAIDDKDFGFPESRAVALSRLDLLDNEGIEAIATKGFPGLFGASAEGDEKAPEGVGEAAKNS